MSNNDYQSGGGGGYRDNEMKVLSLRDNDLVFSKNRDGILSCGYKVSNALLNATLSFPMVGGGGGGSDGDVKKTHGKNKSSDIDLKTAKLMEDLVVPSSLYYGRPATKDKVFKYKKGKVDKGKKKNTSGSSKSNDASDSESDDNVIEESLYDKLLSLVSQDKKVKYDKKTRKGGVKNVKKTVSPKNNIAGEAREAREAGDSGENAKIKIKTKKTRKVRFNM